LAKAPITGTRSTGAVYARIFAGRHPEQVSGMVLLDGQPVEAFDRLPDYPVFYRHVQRISSLLPRRVYSSFRDEFATLPRTLQQARAFPTLGHLPLAVVTASRDAQPGWLPLQDEMAALSSNSRHVVVPYAHADVVLDPDAAVISSQVIGEVVRAVRRARPI
jgi:pimeloyl-ACP methyl ester carboxylesterase